MTFDNKSGNIYIDKKLSKQKGTSIMEMEKTAFHTYPVVFAVENDYHISVCVKEETLMWVRVNGVEYYDHSNGILRSASFLHKIIVPMSELDRAESYTVCYRRVIDRKPYYSETGEIEEYTFDFKPYKSGDINIYCISDAHYRTTGPVKAAEYFGKTPDLLILNGDIPDHSGVVENFKTIYEIGGEISKGNIPVIFSRGNHDTRGICAEQLEHYTPTSFGKSYYSVKLGELWCLVLDCGEDKRDGSIEYGNTICCHSMRIEQTKFIENIIKNADTEYNAENVKKKMVVCHIPFTMVDKEPFDIEQELYAKWTELVAGNINPDFYLFGHKHESRVVMPGDEDDFHNQQRPVILAWVPIGDIAEQKFEGCAVSYKGNKVSVAHTNQDKEVICENHWEI